MSDKSIDQRIADKVAKQEKLLAAQKNIREQIAQLRKQQAIQNRKARTKRLIEAGAAVEHALGDGQTAAGENLDKIVRLIRQHWNDQ